MLLKMKDSSCYIVALAGKESVITRCFFKIRCMISSPHFTSHMIKQITNNVYSPPKFPKTLFFALLILSSSPPW